MKATNFLKAIEKNNLNKFVELYNDWLKDISESDGWPTDNGTWIPLTSVIEASTKIDDFDRAGVYIFGATLKNGEKIPRYIGKTGKPSNKSARCFYNRFNRYFWSANSQFYFLRKYYKDIHNGKLKDIKNGFDEFINESKKNSAIKSKNKIENIKEEYREFLDKSVNGGKCQSKNNKYRCIGGLDFALHGVDNMWFAFLVVEDETQIKELEEHLIPLAIITNYENGYLPIVNITYYKEKFERFCEIKSIS